MVHNGSKAYLLEARPPTPAEYLDLCQAVGWHEAINFQAAPLSLQRSLYAVTAVAAGDDTWAVGMGRIVGDGALYFYVQDIAVRPEWQGQGIGRAIMDALMEWMRTHAPEQAFVGLFAASGRENFYHHYGFLHHPSLTGMFTVVHVHRPVEEWG
ncbi:MAG: GNAT family N-acetyltransferase [Caldilineaceae bacterium]